MEKTRGRLFDRVVFVTSERAGPGLVDDLEDELRRTLEAMSEALE